MLKNKIIVKKIRNIFILLMAIIIMLGAYRNIRNSKAENVIQIEMEVSDKSNILSAQTITVDATETSDGNYLLTLPTSVNKNIVTKYYTSSGEEILVDADNNISTIQLTDEEVANKKVQVQSDYDTKEVTVNNQTKLLYNKELQELPNESGTGSQDVIVTGYMPLDVDIEVKEMDLATLTSVKLPSENQTMQKAYEISIFEIVEKQGTETNTTNEVQTQTMENGAQNTDSTQQDVATQADVEPQSEVAEQATTQTENTERVEYDSSVYGEKITVKTKQEQTNAIKTYTLAEDNKVTEVANVTSGEYVDFESDKGNKILKYIIATQENEAEENISLMSEDTNSDIATYASSSSTLKSVTTDEINAKEDGAFLGSSNIKRQNIESVTFNSTTTDATMPKGLIRSFDGGSYSGTTWTDLTKNKNGVVKGGSFGSDGNGNYLSLNGTASQWVNLGRMEMFLKEQVTLDVIIKVSDVSQTSVILGNVDDGGVEIALKAGKPRFSIWFKNDTAYTRIDTSNAIKANKSTRITGTYNGTTMALYVDGVQVGTKTKQNGIIHSPSNDTVMAIGCNPIGSSSQQNYFKGKIYSVKMYNKGLTGGEIAKGWNSSEQGVLCGLIRAMDGNYNTKGTGHKTNATTWYDLTGNQNGAIMNGAQTAHTASTVSGKWGTNYFKFNGSTDWVNLGQIDTSITNKITLDAIVEVSDNTKTYGILSNIDDGGVEICLSKGQPKINLWFEGEGDYTRITAAKQIDQNTPTRITGIYNGTTMALYVNGQLVEAQEIEYFKDGATTSTKIKSAGQMTILSKKGTIHKPKNNTVMAIGCNPTGSSGQAYYFKGNIYSAKIYNKGLSQSQIQQIWDVSSDGDNSILAWRTQTGPYKVNIGSYNNIYANSDSSYLFSYIGQGSTCTETSVINGLELLNTSSATNMEGMFKNCGYRKMTGLSLGSNFYTSNVTNMKDMFSGCGQTQLTSFNLGSNFNTSRVTNMSGMFQNFAYNLGSLNLGTQFYTSAVTDMSNMFSGCGQTQLTSFNLGSNFNTSRVTNMSGMFQNFAYNLGSLNLGTQFYTSAVTNMSNMFNGCGKTELTTFSLGSNFNTSKVTNMSGMFQDFAPKLVSLNLGTQFYTSAVTDMSNMFYNCGTTAMTSLDLGPAFTKIASSYTDFATNCGKSGSITIYSGSAIYSNSNAFRLGANSSVTIGFSRGTINPKYKPEWSIQSYSVSGSSLVVTLTGNVNTTNYTGDSIKTVTNRFTNGSTNLVRAKVDGNSSANNTITKTISNANSTAAQTVTCTLTLANFAESVRQSGNNFLEWSGNVSIDFIPTTIEDAYGNPNLFKADGTVMFTDVIKPEFTYEYTNTTIDHGTKTVTIVFDVADKFFSSSALSTDSSASNIDVVVGGVTATNATKTLTKIEDLSTTINGTSKKTGERYRLVITNLDQGGGNDYSGIMTLAFPADIVTDTSSNGNLAKTITVGIDDPTNGDGHDSGVIVDVVDPIWKIENINIDKTGKKVTADLIATDKYLTGVENSTLTTSGITVSVDGDTNANTVITKSLTEPTFFSNAITGMKEIKYTLTLTNFEEATRQTGKSFLEYSGAVKITVAAGTITDVPSETGGSTSQTQSNSSKEQEFQLGQVDFLNPRFIYEYANTTINHETKTVTVVFDATDKYFNSSALSTDTTASNITVIVDGTTATNATKTLTKLQDITETVNGTSKKVGEKYQLVISNLDQGDGGSYSGVMTLVFPENIVTDTEANGNLAKTITIGIDDPTTGDGHDTGIIVDVVDPIWKVENINIDKTNKKVTADLIATDKYLTGVENSTLTTSDITVSVDGDANANTVIAKSLSTPTFSTNETTGLKEIKYALTLNNFEEATKQTGKSFLEYSGTVKITVAAGTITDDTSGEGGGNGVRPSVMFDANGTNTDGLHIGDFVNYDAGTWTQEEINAIQTGLASSTITANGSTSLPSSNFQFGGFTAGASRNENATPYKDIFGRSFDYIKDETGNAVTGWRVFDIEGDNVTLISVGCPEDYYRSNGNDSGYINEYILTGNVNSNWSGADTSAYQKRNWSNYVNLGQKAISATVLTKSKLDSWYSKYITAGADTYNDTTFQQIYTEPYIKFQSIVDSYSNYTFSEADMHNSVYYFSPNSRLVTGNSGNDYVAKGVRVLVSLSSDVLFNSQKTGTKTLTSGNMATYGGNQTYNCWAIAEGSSSGTTDGQSNTSKEQEFELGHVDFIKPRIEKESATKDETAKTETIILNVMDKYLDTTDALENSEITVYIDGENVTGLTKTLSKNTRTTATTSGGVTYETNGDITAIVNGTSQIVGQQYKLVLSDFEQATNNSKKYKDWSGTVSIDVAEGAVKDQISASTANTNELTTLKGDFVDFITPYLTYQYLTTDIDRTGADADGKSFQMAFEVTDKYYESGKLSIDDLSIQMADGKHTYDLKNTPVTITLNSDESITAPNVKMTNKTTGEVETVTSTTIGHKYVLTISNLEQLEIAEGNTTLDYSGIVTVAVDANKISDRTGNTNIAKTITSGVSIPDETGDGVVVDVVKPIWRKTSDGSIDFGTKTANIVVKGTDTYYASNSLTVAKLRVYAYSGTTQTDITSSVNPTLSAATRLDESVTVNGTTSTRQYGVQYTITLTNIPVDKDQVKIVIPANTLTDQSGNTNDVYELKLFTTLKSAASEKERTSAFLGNSSIQRQNIESVTFLTSASGAANNKWDVSAAQDGSIWAWYTGSGPYQVYIGSDEFMCANQDSSYLFSYIGYDSSCTAENVINGLNYLNTVKATNMKGMFDHCGYTAMTSLDLGDKFDTSNVTDMDGMFWSCGYTAMTSLDLGDKFDTSNVTIMDSMFFSCGYTAMISLDLGDKFDTSNVRGKTWFESTTGMSMMFFMCGYKSMTNLDLGDKFDTSNVTSMMSMFGFCGGKMTSLDLGDKFDTSNVINMSNMFSYCGYESMISLNLGDKFDTSNVTTMDGMFDYCGYTAMTSLDLGDKFDTSNVTNMKEMFENCGKAAMTTLDLGPKFTKITSENADFMTNCGTTGTIIYAPEAIYKDRTSFKLNSGDTSTASGAIPVETGRTINPIYKPEWEKVSSSLDTTTNPENPTISVVVKGSANKSETINGVNINYNSQVTSGLTKDNISVYIDGELDGDTNKNGVIDAGETPSITKTVTSASPSSTSAEVTHTITLSGLEEALRQNGKSFKEWSGNIAIKIGGRGEATDTYTANVLTDEYGNQSMMETDASGTWIDVLYKDTDTDHNVNGTMFADFVKPEFTYEYSNTTINHETKTVTIVFDVTDKYFNSSALSTDTTASNIDVVAGGTTPTNATKALTKLQDLTATVNGTSKKVGERYQLVITNLDQGGGNDYSGIMTLAFPADIITDMSINGNLAKTITIGIDDPTTGDGDDTGVIVDVVDPIWKVENINIDKTNKKVTADLIATDKYLTGVENSTLTTNDITVSVDDDVNANTVITKSLNEPTFSTNETTGMKEIKYTLTLDNFEQATKQTGKSFLEYSGTVKITVAAGTVRDDASAIAETRTDGQSNTNKEKTFELGHVDFIKPRIEKQSATKDETAKTETIIINVIDKYIDTTKEITADEITIYADEEIVTGITKTFSKNTRTTPATEEDLRYETNGNITTTINGTSKVIGQQYKLVLSDFEQATNNSKKYKDWSGTISIDVAEGAVKDQISGTTANTNELTTLKGDFVDFITPYLTYQYLTTDIDRTGADADGKSFQMAFEVTDKYYESGKLSIDDLSIQMADGKHTYDLKNTPVTITLNSDESITAPNVKMTNKTTGEIETVASATIGHKYVLTISNLEQLEIAEGNTTLDYSGIVTVAVGANKISDRSGNKNIAKTITSGVSIPDETGDGVVVDVVKPIWRRTTGGSLDLTTKTASLVVKGTDTYYASNSLTAGKIKVYAYTGTTPTDITSLVSPALSTATRLDESVTVDGVTSTRQYGVQYTITLTGIPIDKDQVKVVIPAGTLTDQSGNTNEEYETRLFTTLQSAAGETAATSAFLGNSSIQRQNIESVTFVSGLEGAANNKWDVSAAQDGSIWAWYTGSGPYQVYIGSDEFMCANQDSRYLFSYIGYAPNSAATNVINGLEYLNIITATNMSYMFNYCGYQKMTSLNLGNNFDTTNVTNMAGMFQNCGQTKMTSINLGTQFYTSKVTDMSNMFNGCGQTELITFSLGSNFDTTKVTNMSGMFQNFAHKLGILNLGTQFYTSEVTDMSNMFNGCGQNAMTTLTLGTNFDTTKVTNMSQMFKDFAKSSTGMTSLDLGDSFYTTSVTDMTRMFNGCGQTAMVALDLGPAFTKIASANTDFATNCGASGIVIYAPESIYSNRTSFKLNKTGQ